MKHFKTGYLLLDATVGGFKMGGLYEVGVQCGERRTVRSVVDQLVMNIRCQTRVVNGAALNPTRGGEDLVEGIKDDLRRNGGPLVTIVINVDSKSAIHSPQAGKLHYFAQRHASDIAVVFIVEHHEYTLFGNPCEDAPNWLKFYASSRIRVVNERVKLLKHKDNVSHVFKSWPTVPDFGLGYAFTNNIVRRSLAAHTGSLP